MTAAEEFIEAARLAWIFASTLRISSRSLAGARSALILFLNLWPIILYQC